MEMESVREWEAQFKGKTTCELALSVNKSFKYLPMTDTYQTKYSRVLVLETGQFEFHVFIQRVKVNILVLHENVALFSTNVKYICSLKCNDYHYAKL